MSHELYMKTLVRLVTFLFVFSGIRLDLIALVTKNVNETMLIYVNNESNATVWPGKSTL